MGTGSSKRDEALRRISEQRRARASQYTGTIQEPAGTRAGGWQGSNGCSGTAPEAGTTRPSTQSGLEPKLRIQPQSNQTEVPKVALAKQGLSLYRYLRHLPARKETPDEIDAKDYFNYRRNARKGNKAAIFGTAGLVGYKVTSLGLQAAVAWLNTHYPDLPLNEGLMSWLQDWAPTTAGALCCTAATYLIGRLENYLKYKHLELWTAEEVTT